MSQLKFKLTTFLRSQTKRLVSFIFIYPNDLTLQLGLFTAAIQRRKRGYSWIVQPLQPILGPNSEKLMLDKHKRDENV